jgi:hypothetical protein
MKPISERVEEYPEFLEPLKAKAKAYLKYPSSLGEDGALRIGHRPWVARLNYMLTLYPGIDTTGLDKYCRTFSIEIPGIYADFLRVINGAFCFGISLCGVPPSMLGDPPQLYAATLQCHDLATAAKQWIRDYAVSLRLFHFGGRDFSETEIVGYFIGEGPRILCVRKNGEVIAEWTSFTDFLSDELAESEVLEEELNPSEWDG